MAVFEPNDYPLKKGEGPNGYVRRLEADGARELILRKALLANFDLEIREVIEICAECPVARQREIDALRTRFPTLSRKRFAWRIGQSMTLSKPEAQKWADKVLDAEDAA